MSEHEVGSVPGSSRLAAALDGADKAALRALLTASVRRRALEHLEGHASRSTELSRLLHGDTTVADVLEGRADLDVVLLVRLEEVLEVALWPDHEELKRLARSAQRKEPGS